MAYTPPPQTFTDNSSPVGGGVGQPLDATTLNNMVNALTGARYAADTPINGVTDYGMRPNSNQNDTALIQAAFDAASTSRRPVDIPPGVYYANNLVMNQFTAVRGMASSMSRFEGTGSPAGVIIRHIAGSTTPLLTISGAGCLLENILLDGNNATGDVLVTSGFEPTLTRVRIFQGAGCGLRITSGNNTRFDDVLIDNCGSTATAAMIVKSNPPSTTNTLDFRGLGIERSANVALEIAVGTDPNIDYAEFIRIVNLHIEAPADAGGVPNVDPLVRLGNIRSVMFVAPFIYGGAGPLVSHEYQATRGNPMGGIQFIGGTLLGRKSDIGGTPDYLVRLVSGNDCSFIGTRFDMCSIAAVKVEAAYGNGVYFDASCTFTSRVPALITDARTSISYYQTRGFLTVEQDITGNRHLIAGQPALGGSAVAGAPALQNVSGCNDVRGTIFFGSGAAPAAGGQLVLTFNRAYATAPRVIAVGTNAATRALGITGSATTTQLTIYTDTAPAANQAGNTYQATYFVIG